MVAGGAARGARPRAFIDRVLTPVWEANHVWLIFVLVVTWTAFPRGFAAITAALYVPLFLAAVGIVLRGAGFAFRHIVRGTPGQRALGATFAISSVLTPFFMGCVAGAIATRGVLGGGNPDGVSTWLSLPSIGIGALLVASCGYLAAVFLVDEARRAGDEEMQSYFRVRALVAAAVAGVLAVIDLFLLADNAPDLLGRALVLVVASAVFGIGAIVQLLRGGRARMPAAAAVACVVAGWAVAQGEYILPGWLTYADAAAPPATMITLFVVFGVALLWVVPALVLMLSLQQRGMLGQDDDGDAR
jgi:cytochrome d ubiquinol oxidase subunit II